MQQSFICALKNTEEEQNRESGWLDGKDGALMSIACAQTPDTDSVMVRQTELEREGTW